MSIPKIYGLIPKVMADVGAIGKERTNDFQKYKFRGIEDMYNAVHPAFIKHGVFCAPEVIDATSTEHDTQAGKASFRVLLKVKHRFYADDGSCVEVTTMGEGIDTSDKATNKAMSAAMKYAFIELLSIPTEDVADSDRDHPEVQPKQRSQVVGVIKPAVPAQGDGFPRSEYVVPFGKKHRGRTLKQIYDAGGPAALTSYVAYIENSAKENGTPVSPEGAEFIRQTELFLGAIENAPAAGSNG